MSANIEIKARSSSLLELRGLLSAAGAVGPIVLHQEDTFFEVSRGRLKMRCDEVGQCELIYYRRSDSPGLSRSDYFRKSLANPDAERHRLAMSFGITRVIRKTRELFLLGDVRVHIDDVEGLGGFVEVEVPVNGADEHRARARATQVARLLGIDSASSIAGAYVDLSSAPTQPHP